MVNRETGFRSAAPARPRVYELPVGALAPRGRRRLVLLVLYILLCDAVIYHELAGARHWDELALAVAGTLIGLVKLRTLYRRRHELLRFTLGDRVLTTEEVRGDRVREARAVPRDDLRAVEVAIHPRGFRIELRTRAGVIAIDPPSTVREPLDAIRAELARFLKLGPEIG